MASLFHRPPAAFFIGVILCLLSRAPLAAAQGLAKISKEPYIGAIVADADTGRVLFEDNADAKAYPASTLKLMVLLLILEKIEAKELSLDDEATVSAEAERMGGTQVWLKKGETFTLDELLYALIIRSANDAAVAIAERAAGSKDAFIELMNERAKELFMFSTSFQSPHGLPPSRGFEPDTTTARDMMLLAKAVLKHPSALRYTSTRKLGFRNDTVMMETHNHLLNSFNGCDGLKTGYFSAAGFSIVATAKRGDARLIAVVLGSKDRKVRDAKTAELLERGFFMLSRQRAKQKSDASAAAQPR